ncbi:D-alanyl-D-alanine carboxypeptidase family protein [Proteinivorax hydrogeniformans]|uniref:serine-type D-Ala-D-Ala carboxypeptidase n=1 Tax=Proteinivorax hydrogeniformans TaxID=1826727 RepID=A0AAU8HQT1_9FIRM
MRKILICILIAVVCFSGTQIAFGQEFELECEAALLMEPVTGKVVFEHEAHKPFPIASITKVMTLLLAVEAIEEGKVSLDDMVVASQRAAEMGGSQIFLEKGQKVSLENLLIAVASGSANDASVAVAEHVGTSVEGFVEDMNAKARELGMKNTNFLNPSGLPIDEEENLSTAYDVALVSRELLKYPMVHKWATVEWDTEFLGDVYLSNTNLKFLINYPGADGLKTGWTTKAGHCISATALRDDTRFLAVILKSPSPDQRLKETSQLLNYGFGNYKTQTLHTQGESIKTIEVEKGSKSTVDVKAKDNISLLLDKKQEGEISTNIDLPKRLNAPISNGETVGVLEVKRDGTVIEKFDLIVEEEITQAGTFQLFGRSLKELLRTVR